MKKFYDGFPSLHDMIIRLVAEKYQITVADIPSWENREAPWRFKAKLCRDFVKLGQLETANEESDESDEEETEEDQESDVEDSDDSSIMGGVEESESGISMDLVRAPPFNMIRQLPVVALFGTSANALLLFNYRPYPNFGEQGSITQESLTTMIRQDEITPVRSRRRMHYLYGPFGDSSGKMQYPHGQLLLSGPHSSTCDLKSEHSDPLHVGRWVKAQYGTRSSVTAVFMTHAVINDNSSVSLQFRTSLVLY